jgi:hypothetical protein
MRVEEEVNDGQSCLITFLDSFIGNWYFLCGEAGT